MWMLQVPCWWEQSCTWKHVNGLGCAITDMFHFLQACGFWCQLLENDTSQLPLPNYILWLIFVYDLCMLKGQAALGWFIVVRTENRWGEHAGWNHCLAHLWGGCPWLWVMGPGASTQQSTAGLADGVAADISGVWDRLSNDPGGRATGPKPVFLSRSFLAFVNSSFRS